MTIQLLRVIEVCIKFPLNYTKCISITGIICGISVASKFSFSRIVFHNHLYLERQNAALCGNGFGVGI